MCVNIRRRAQVGVPEQLLNQLQISSSLVDDSCGRVTECVEPCGSAHASDSEAIQRWVEHVTSEHVGVKRRTVLFAEDEIVSAVVICVLFLSQQCSQKRDRSRST